LVKKQFEQECGCGWFFFGEVNFVIVFEFNQKFGYFFFWQALDLLD
jgi:hypothetical protein